jgi:threonine/homoserine/homoserine lactone efflux protein
VVVPDASTLSLFVSAALVLLLTPGPAVFYIVTRSVEQGRRAGLLSVLGILLGTLFHIAAAALGISALLLSSAMAFNTLRYLGAAYLVYLGVRMLVGQSVPPERGTVPASTARQIVSQGVVINLLNPHTSVFFFAFLPQFVDPSKGGARSQILVLGIVFLAVAAMTDAAWAILTGTAGDWLKGSPRFTRIQRYITAGALIGLGAAAAVSGNGRK